MNFKFDETALDSSQKGWKTLLEKEKLRVTSNFSFFYNVFKRLVQQTRKNKGFSDNVFKRLVLQTSKNKG